MPWSKYSIISRSTTERNPSRRRRPWKYRECLTRWMNGDPTNWNSWATFSRNLRNSGRAMSSWERLNSKWPASRRSIRLRRVTKSSAIKVEFHFRFKGSCQDILITARAQEFERENIDQEPNPYINWEGPSEILPGGKPDDEKSVSAGSRASDDEFSDKPPK